MHRLILCDNGNLESVLALAGERGLGIELQSFYHPNVLDSPAEAVAAHRRLLAGFDGPLSLHGPFGDLCPGSLDPLVRQVARQRIEQAADVAAQLGVADMVLHHGYIPHSSKPARWIARSVVFWRDILSRLPAGTRIHLENLLEDEPDTILALVQEVGDARLGICLDIGHAHALSKVPAVGWVQRLGPAITYVHLHDNRGTTDEHLPLGRGNLPVRQVLLALEVGVPGAVWAIEADAEPSLAWLEEDGFVARRREATG